MREHQDGAGERLHRKDQRTSFWRANLPPQFFYLAMQESNFDPSRERAADALGHRQRHVAVHSRNRASDMA